jgi:hypothetical protein
MTPIITRRHATQAMSATGQQRSEGCRPTRSDKPAHRPPAPLQRREPARVAQGSSDVTVATCAKPNGDLIGLPTSQHTRATRTSPCGRQRTPASVVLLSQAWRKGPLESSALVVLSNGDTVDARPRPECRSSRGCGSPARARRHCRVGRGPTLPPHMSFYGGAEATDDVRRC